MKLKNFKKLLVLVVVSGVVVGCGPKKPPQGAGSGDLNTLIETYKIENQELTRELDRKSKELEIAKVRLDQVNSDNAIGDDTIQKLKELLESSNGAIDIQGGVLVLDNKVTFSPGSDKVSSSGKSILRKIVNSGYLKAGTIYVMGHTDTDPITRTRKKHTSNFELSSKRAAHVVESLMALGVPGKRMVVMGYGQFKPVPGASKSKQRRIAIKVVK